MTAPTRGGNASTTRFRAEREDLDRCAGHALNRMAVLPEGRPERVALRERVIEMYLPMARRLARRYATSGEPADDLCQVAAVGLIRAVDRFDADKGETFAAYAIPTIVGELKRHFRDRVPDLRIPRTVHERISRIRTASSELEQTLGRVPTIADVAESLDLPEELVIDAIAHSEVRRTVSLDSLTGPSPAGFAPRDWFGADDPALMRAEDRVTVEPLLAQLPERERRIVMLSFFRQLSQNEIAARVGISQMHVSRLLARAVATMRARAAAEA